MLGNLNFSTTSKQLRAFCALEPYPDRPAASGNPCLVTRLAEPPAQAPAQSAIAQCVSWPLAEQRAAVQCWAPGGSAILCCGHGLLCCASVWLDDWGQRGTLVMNGSEVDCHAAEGKVWLGFQPLQPVPCDVPDWCKYFFAAEPIAAATAGVDNAYLILEWPKGFNLASLATPQASLSQYTQRALIATCAADPATATYAETIQYRYFAPQHGVAEDTATGSAMRVLASYWQQRGQGQTLTAYQCSAAGGLLFSRIAEAKVWVGGWTVPMAKESKNFE